MTGYRFLDAIHLEASQIQPVDCGTCPVTLACAIGQGGTGYVFKCCGSTGVETRNNAGEKLFLIIDCARHAFTEFKDLRAFIDLAGRETCPMCNGQIIDDVLANPEAGTWVPTVHSKVPIETRLDTWRRAHPGAVARANAIKDRKKISP